MTTIERLRETTQALSLAAVQSRLEGLLEKAGKTEPSYGDFLLEIELVQREWNNKRAKVGSTRDGSILRLKIRRPACRADDTSAPPWILGWSTAALGL